MARFNHASLQNNAPTAHMFYTGFTWEEIEQILAALKKTYKASPLTAGDDESFFDYPGYGGLPKSIYKRFSMTQMDIIEEIQPKTMKQLASCLAEGNLR